MSFASRGGQKLDHALAQFGLDVTDKCCADLGCSTGGFTDCLLQRGVRRVYAVDTGYGVLDWRLRNDPRVVVMERTNAMHVTLPEAVDVVTIDVAWTRQRHILPAARRLLAAEGRVVTLVKPHYEAEATMIRGGLLGEEHLQGVLATVVTDIGQAAFEVLASVESPIRGAKGNREWLYLLREAAGVRPKSLYQTPRA